ncbi:tRNA lysidine(34) synthetase TilS [Pyruvatibacter sp.]|uniref:tRNA lysidine(34) synthetase TilS n=1 Tax=Pyruvatibacter sp. TaxID=1981328 RepID=UPI00326629BD
MAAKSNSPDFEALLTPFGLSRTDAVAVAVSGGPDSMALLLLAADEAKRSGRSVHAVTVDHGLRADAKDEAEQVAAWAKALGVAHTTLTHEGDVPVASIQAEARDIRYGLMGQWCAANDVAALMVAHTQDDQAETLLLRLARGSGVDGLSGMAADMSRDGLRIIRPLLDVPRADLLALLEDRGQAYIEDPSNRDERHARVRMRVLRPLLEAEGLTALRLAETAGRLSVARDALAGWTQAHLAGCVTFDVGGWAQFDRTRLVNVPLEIGLRSVSRIVMAVGGGVYPPRLHHTRALLDRLGAAEFSGATLGGVRFVAHRSGVLAFREARAMAEPVSVEGTSPLLWDHRFEVSIADAKQVDSGSRSIGALGVPGARRLRDELGPEVINVPSAAASCIPAVYAQDRLLEVPALGYRPDGAVPSHRIAFVGPMRAGVTAAPIGIEA